MPSRLGHQAALAVQELVEGAVAPSERWVQYYADKILAAIEKATDQVMIWREHNRDSAEGRSAGREDYLKLWTQHIEQCSTDRLVLLVQADPRESTAGSYDSDRGQLVYYVPASFFDTANGKEKDSDDSYSNAGLRNEKGSNNPSRSSYSKCKGSAFENRDKRLKSKDKAIQILEDIRDTHQI